MKIRRSLYIGVLTVLLLWILMDSVSAQLGGNLTKDESDYINITVNVSTECMIDVQPAALAWDGVAPGSVGDNNTEVLGDHYFAIQIENIGSRNITRVWFNATYPAASPFARGSAAFTDAGNYVVLSNDTSSTNPPANGFFFINRVEYNETRQLVYLRDPAGNLPPNSGTYTYGRFRNATNEYFWMYDQTYGNCNTSGTLWIGTEPHTRTQTGTTNFQSQAIGGTFTTTQLTTYNCAGLSYAVGNVNSSSPLAGYSVAMSPTCQLFFSRWNRDCPFDYSGTTAVFADDVVGFPTATLWPGDSFALAIKVYVPYGIYEGQSVPGKIWAIATSA
ncbi:MAG: hypothetical protein JW778_03640 [Candidatus Altiarchaeota archaeon]|nr:hypothetical protein [Candidatus Altiarchaeota archaeon]